jgi:hypothetical protein
VAQLEADEQAAKDGERLWSGHVVWASTSDTSTIVSISDVWDLHFQGWGPSASACLEEVQRALAKYSTGKGPPLPRA